MIEKMQTDLEQKIKEEKIQEILKQKAKSEAIKLHTQEILYKSMEREKKQKEIQAIENKKAHDDIMQNAFDIYNQKKMEV